MFTRLKITAIAAVCASAMLTGAVQAVETDAPVTQKDMLTAECLAMPDVREQLDAGRTIAELLAWHVCLSDMLAGGVSAADLIAAGAEPNEVLEATAACLVPSGGRTPASLGGIGGGIGGGAGGSTDNNASSS